MSVEKTFGYGNGSPYRSVTFNKNNELIFDGNGPLKIETLFIDPTSGNIVLENVTFVQQGIIVAKQGRIEIPFPTVPAPFYLTASVPDSRPVDNISWNFVRRPQDIGVNLVLLAEWDGSEFRPLDDRTIQAIMDSRVKAAIAYDNLGFNKGFQLGIAPDRLTYTVSPGVLTDTSGRLTEKVEQTTIPAIAPDEDWNRIDSIVYRKLDDSENRIGQFILRPGATFEGSNFVINPETVVGDPNSVKNYIKCLILSNNDCIVLNLEHYGENGQIVATRYEADRTTEVVSRTVLATNIQSFDATLDSSENICIALESNADISRAKYSSADFSELLAPAQVETLSNPSINPSIDLDYLGNWYITFLYQAGPSTFTPYLVKLNLGGSISKPAFALLSSTAKYTKISLRVTNDLEVKCVFTNGSGTVEYVEFDELGLAISSREILNSEVEHNGTIYIDYKGRNGQLHLTENGRTFVTWETEKSIDHWGVTLKDFRKDMPEIIDFIDPTENILTHTLEIDWQNHGYFLFNADTTTYLKKINLETMVSRQDLVLTHNPSGNLLGVLFDKTGSLIVISSDLSSGYTDLTPVLDEYFSGPDSYGAEHEYLTAEEIAIKNTDLASLPQAPTTGDLFEVITSSTTNDGVYEVYSKRSAVIDGESYTVFRAVGAVFAAEDGSASAANIKFSVKTNFDIYIQKTTASTEYTYSTIIEDNLDTDLLLASINIEDYDFIAWYDQYRVRLNDPATRGESLIVCEGDITWDLASSTLDWMTDFMVIDPFRNKYVVPTGNIVLNEGQILYMYYPRASYFTQNGDTNTVTLDSTNDFYIGQEVFIGDTDSAGIVTTVVSLTSATVELADNVDAFSTLRGAYIIPRTVEFKTEDKNRGDLKPDKEGNVCSRVYTIATRDNDKIIFREGALTLEDGESGNIGDGTPTQILDYIGAKNDADDTPDYTNALGAPVTNTTVIDGESLTKSIKRLDMKPDIVEARTVSVDLTALPLTSPVTIDGALLVTGDLVLFTMQPLDGVFELTDNAGTVSWEKRVLFKGSEDPANGALVNILGGDTPYFKTIWERHLDYWAPIQVKDAVREPVGFLDNVSSVFTTDNLNHTFTITPKVSFFDTFELGRIFRFYAPKTIDIGATYGVYYIYLDGYTLMSTTSYADTKGHSTVAEVLYDGTEFLFIGDMRNGITMDESTRGYLYSIFGARLAEGLDISNFVLDGDGSSDAHAQLSLSDGDFRRQDLIIPITDGVSTEQFVQELFPIAHAPVMYRTGASGSTNRDVATEFIAKSGTNTITYNKYDSSWSTEDVPNGQFVTYFLFATHDVNEPVVSIMGQSVHATLSEAQEQDQFDSLAFADFPKRDFKILYRVIFQADSAYTNNIKAKMVYVDDVRAEAGGGNFEVAAPNDHGLLTGLSDPDHTPTALTTEGVVKDGGLSASDIDAKNVFETLNKLLGQFRIKEHPTNKKRVLLTGADRILNDGTTLSQVVKNLLLKFEGAEIDFSLGKVFEIDGTTDLGLDFVPPVIPAANWHWFTVAIVPSTVNTDLTINGQVLVLPAATSGATKDAAEKAPFTNNTNIGMVAVQENGGTIKDIFQEDIRQLGVGSGSGGGGGLGDLTAIEEELRTSLRYSPYQWVTPFDYRKVADEYTDNGTVGYDIANSVYKFDAGEYLETVNVLDDSFKTEIMDIRHIDVHIFQGEDRDELMTVTVTANGSGVAPTYYPVSLHKIGESGHYLGTVDLQVVNVSDPILDLVPETHSVLSFDNANRKYMAMPFTPDEKWGINSITMKVNKNGNPLGLLSARIVPSSGGSPDMSQTIAASSGVMCSDLAAGDNDVNFDFVRFSIGKGVQYFVLLETDSIYINTSDASNYLGLDYGDKPAAYTSGVLQMYDGTGWASSANGAADMHFTGNVFDIRVKYVAGTTDSILEGIGVLYGDSYDLVHGGDLRNTQTFQVNGDDDQTSFTLGNFMPDAKILKVYDPTTGQVYTHEAFSINGYTVTFQAGTFDLPGEIFFIHFDQYEGNGFDNSDMNRNVLQSNHLGSTNPTADFSTAGRGIILRRPDGTLREIRINDDDNLEVLEV